MRSAARARRWALVAGSIALAAAACSDDRGPDDGGPGSPGRLDGRFDPEARPVSCPAELGRISHCATPGDTCSVMGACCLCEVIESCGVAPQWTCHPPSTNPACGSTVPVLMTACGPGLFVCYYCDGQTPVSRSCDNGLWRSYPLRYCT